jgi:hypothetical protein
VVTKGFLSLKAGTQVKPVHPAAMSGSEQTQAAAPE